MDKLLFRQIPDRSQIFTLTILGSRLRLVRWLNPLTNNKHGIQKVISGSRITVWFKKKTNNEQCSNTIIVPGKTKIKVRTDDNYLEGILTLPENNIGGLVIFVHGSGSSRNSLRNEYLSKVLNESRISTLLINLLTKKEIEIDNKTKEYRFNIELLTRRLLIITDSISQYEVTKLFKFGYFASSTGTPVAIKAAVHRYNRITTIVSRSGRLDLVDSDSLMNSRLSILLIVGGKDIPVIDLSYKIIHKLDRASFKKIILIAGASHLFAEPGKIEQIARIAVRWFKDNLSNK